jgi:hypothetical protein
MLGARFRVAHHKHAQLRVAKPLRHEPPKHAPATLIPEDAFIITAGCSLARDDKHMLVAGILTVSEKPYQGPMSIALAHAVQIEPGINGFGPTRKSPFGSPIEGLRGRRPELSRRAFVTVDGFRGLYLPGRSQRLGFRRRWKLRFRRWRSRARFAKRLIIAGDMRPQLKLLLCQLAATPGHCGKLLRAPKPSGASMLLG